MESPKYSQEFYQILLSEKLKCIDINNDPLSGELIKKCSDEEKDYLNEFENKTQNILKFFFSNKTSIHKFLDDNDKSININQEILKHKFSSYFYLVLLIQDDPEIINYKYEIVIIQDFDKQKSKGIYYDVLKAKIIMELIENYKNIEDVDIEMEEEKKEEILNQIKKINIDKIKETSTQSLLQKYDIAYNEININSDDLETIYINFVIKVLLKPGNVEEKNEKEKEFVEKFLDELDLENIEITMKMFDELVKFFDEEQNNEINKYNISEAKDLYDEKNINFYYNLFKYILKNNCDALKINFLIKLKENISKIFSKETEGLSELKQYYKKSQRFQYILDFLDSNYFSNIFIQPESLYNSLGEDNTETQKESQSGSNFLDIHAKGKPDFPNFFVQNNPSLSTNISQKQDSSNTLYKEYSQNSPSNKNEEEEDADYILEYERRVPKDKDIKNKQIIDKNDGTFFIFDISNHNGDNISYDKNSSNLIGTKIDDNYFNQAKNNDNLVCLINSKIGDLVIFKKEDENNISSENKIKFKNGHFKILNKLNEKKEYIISRDIGFLANFYENMDLDEYSKYIKVNFNGALKIADNLYAFVSNAIYDHGENKLIILNKFQPQIIDCINKEEGKYSINIGNNSLYLINIDDKYKLLLCACKSYVPGTQNGILTILIEINKYDFKTSPPRFYPTDDFEVNCFYTIHEIKEVNHFYFLVGGFEVEKRRGMVKLYRLSCNISNKKTEIKIKYIQDAIENFDGFQDFGMINNISKHTENDIKISCLTGSDYIFSLPENMINFMKPYYDY